MVLEGRGAKEGKESIIDYVEKGDWIET